MTTAGNAPTQTSTSSGRLAGSSVETWWFRSTIEPTRVVQRLSDACRDAAHVTRFAAGLAMDPAFKEWLEQLADVHDESVRRIETLIQSRESESGSRFRIRSRLRCAWMRLADSLTAGSPLPLMAACRREEYRVQSAYELSLWLLPADGLRESIENRFQQFLLHRSMIPVRRLPRTEQFLMQAERLRQMQLSESGSGAQAKTADSRRAGKLSASKAAASVAVGSNRTRARLSSVS